MANRKSTPEEKRHEKAPYAGADSVGKENDAK